MARCTMRRFGWMVLAAAVLALPVFLVTPRLAAAETAAPAPGKAAEKAQRARVVPEDLELIRDVVYGKGGDKELKLDILRPKRPPAEPMPVVVYIHGGAWKAGSKAGMPALCNRLAQQGYFCASVEYRFSQEAVFPPSVPTRRCGPG